MDERTKLVIKLYIDDKLSLSHVCKQVHARAETIKKILVDHGYQIRTRNATRERKITREILEDLYCVQKMSIVDIAKKT